MSRLTRHGTAEPVSLDQILRHARGQGNIHFPCSADHEQDWQPYPVDPYSAICDDHTYAKRPDVALYTVGPLFLFPPRPLRTAPSRFPNMIRFGNRPPLIQRSVPAHKSLFVRNVVSMLSHRLISWTRLYEVIRWSVAVLGKRGAY